MEAKPTVAVLMSTYNGEKYLREQLDSIFAQEDVDIKLIVRDDGSTDTTLEILSEYSIYKLFKGENIGCEESFKKLLYLSIKSDYYAFADQDDVWHPRKLISAIENITTKNCELSACNLMVVDKDMNLKAPIFSNDRVQAFNVGFKKYIFGSCRGCTLVWSNKLHNIIQSYKPKNTYPHDYWTNTVATVVSDIYMDSECYIKYRLHGNNTSGVSPNIFMRIINTLSKQLLTKHITADVVCDNIIQGYSKYINKEGNKYKQLLLVANYKKSFISKLKLLFSDLINFSSSKKYLYWIAVILNKY